MGLHSHPYAPVLLGLTNMADDKDMLEALDVEGITKEDLDRLIEALEQTCDVSYKG